MCADVGFTAGQAVRRSSRRALQLDGLRVSRQQVPGWQVTTRSQIHRDDMTGKSPGETVLRA
eukprot:364743-Chlamydomonas_euryale.AAC.24